MAYQRILLLLGVVALVAVNASPDCHAQGAIVSAGGPVHRGMGGASTAAPVSALGALYWNPATISGVEHSELEVGLDFLFTDHQVASSVGPLGGSTDAEPGVFPVPNVGWVYHLAQHPGVSFGVGVNAIAGFKTNLAADPTNPALAPAPLGLGRVSSEATFLQLTPVFSVAVTERLSVAAGPLITTAQVQIEPFVFQQPNADGAYSPGRSTRYHWGGGFQAGFYYIDDSCWHVGSSVKSPSWMEEFEFFGQDASGAPRLLNADIDLPLILSLGLGYSGFEDWLLAADARFIDYGNANGFGDPADFDETGAMRGLGWSSVFALSLGVQRQLNEQWFFRGGYSYNGNPISDSESFFNTASPLIYEHMLSAGGSYQLNEKLAINVAYSHYIENTRTGPIVSPILGEIPGSSITNELSANFLSFGVVMRQ